MDIGYGKYYNPEMSVAQSLATKKLYANSGWGLGGDTSIILDFLTSLSKEYLKLPSHVFQEKGNEGLRCEDAVLSQVIHTLVIDKKHGEKKYELMDNQKFCGKMLGDEKGGELNEFFVYHA